MSERLTGAPGRSTLSLHKLGVFCGLAAALWLGTAEAPTKLVNAGFSPFLISMGMVMGAFVARWTVPTLLKGTGFLFQDLRAKPHLIVWALLAGMLWAIANTLTIFAVRNVGLAIAFPLWNTNSLVGLFWGWLLFKELRGSGIKGWAKVLAVRPPFSEAPRFLPSPPRASPMRRERPPSASWPRSAPAYCSAPCIFPIARPISAA